MTALTELEKEIEKTKQYLADILADERVSHFEDRVLIKDKES